MAAADRRTARTPGCSDVDAFTEHMVVYYRRDGLHRPAVYRDGTGPRDRRSPSRSTRCRRARTRSTRSAGSGCGYDSLVTPGLRLRLRRRDRGAHPAAGGGRCCPRPAAAVRAPADYEQYREWAVAGGRHPDPDLAGLPGGHAAGRQRPVPAVRLRQLRELDRSVLQHRPAVAAGPRVRVRDRARPRRRRDGPALVRGGQAAEQDEHVHRLRRLRRAPGAARLDVERRG